MRIKSLELLVGAFLLLAFGALMFLAIQVSGLSGETSKESYRVHALFQNVGGLTERAKVTIAGVSVGRVESITLDAKTQQARVEMAWMPSAPVPATKKALAAAGCTIKDIAATKSHNPFAVNDIAFARATGVDVMYERLGSSVDEMSVDISTSSSTSAVTMRRQVGSWDIGTS